MRETVDALEAHLAERVEAARREHDARMAAYVDVIREHQAALAERIERHRQLAAATVPRSSDT